MLSRKEYTEEDVGVEVEVEKEVEKEVEEEVVVEEKEVEVHQLLLPPKLGKCFSYLGSIECNSN